MEEVKINMLVAQNIETLMKSRDMDPAKLARKAAINPTGVYDILSGKSRSPKIETIGKIAKGLGVPISALFDDSSASGIEAEMMFVFAELPEAERKRLLQTGKAWLSE